MRIAIEILLERMSWDLTSTPWQVAEKVIFRRLLKNAQMQGARNPESGVATNKERLLPRRRVGESARGVLGRTPQRRRMRETQQMGVFQQPVRASKRRES